MSNLPLQQELDDLAPVCAAWDRRERAFEFVVRALPHQLEVALIDWLSASRELVDATRTAVERADFRAQVTAIEDEIDDVHAYVTGAAR